MLPLLDNLDKLQPFLSSDRPALITDIDGTISRIVDNPKEAIVSERCRRCLKELVDHLSILGVISGRRAEEAKDKVGVDGALYVGNHGLERWSSVGTMYWGGTQVYTQLVPEVLASLQDKLDIKGLIFEDKGVAASIHYRQTKDRELARSKIIEALSGIEEKGFSIKEGRMVVDVRPDTPVNKGLAVMSLLEEYEATASICLGDDVTDIDSFSGLRRWAVERRYFSAAIAVLSPEVPEELKLKVDYYLNSIDEVEDFLEWLVQKLQ